MAARDPWELGMALAIERNAGRTLPTVDGVWRRPGGASLSWNAYVESNDMPHVRASSADEISDRFERVDGGAPPDERTPYDRFAVTDETGTTRFAGFAQAVAATGPGCELRVWIHDSWFRISRNATRT